MGAGIGLALLLWAGASAPAAQPEPNVAHRFTPDEIRRLLPPPPPQDVFAPELAALPGCIWRELDEPAKRRLIERAEKVTAFAAVAVPQLPPDEVDTYPAMKRCDPRWEHHIQGMYVAQKVGLIEGAALAMLERHRIGREAVEAVWRDDAALRSELLRVYVRDQSGPIALNEAVLHAAWARLGVPTDQSPPPNSPQAAALSYWGARAWETTVLDPLTKRQNP